ncbi:MAG: UDP-N-acetylmuramoyl-L-alanine--D-glutamate ligase [Myxococcota bacterium]
MTLPQPTEQMLAHLDTLRADLTGRRVGVLGLGIAGRAMALHLAHRGAHVIGADRRADATEPALVAAGVELRAGNVGGSTFADVEALVVSPGVDPRQPAVQNVLARGVIVLGELELVGTLPAPVIGITGTNGKSTTTALTGALLRGLGLSAFVGGNFGEPVVTFIDRRESADALVLELSSYQLETAYRFRADVGVVLNVTPDHLERYASMEDYALAKERLVRNLAPAAVAILNYDDPRVRRMAETTLARCWWLSTREVPSTPHAAWLQGNVVRARGDVAALDGFDLAHPRLLGRHNRENAIAALLGVLGLPATRRPSIEALRRAYLGFTGLAHRLELVGEVGGVLYINDSKATNDDAAAIAVGAMERPAVLLIGGRDKGGGYARTVASAADRARLVIAFGEAQEKVVAAFAGHPGLRAASGFEAAFALAVREARPGEVVLLAPACSSFDEFANYAARGARFRSKVTLLGGGVS